MLDRPLHPYTHGLIGSVPSRNRRGEPLRQIPGMTPCLLNLPPGCAFRTRCPRAEARCAEQPPIAEYRPAASPAASTRMTRRCWHERVLDRSRRAVAQDSVPIIELRGVSKRFGQPARLRRPRSVKRRSASTCGSEVVHAVDDVDLSVAQGEVVGLVGEIRLRQVHPRPHGRRHHAAVRRRR